MKFIDDIREWGMPKQVCAAGAIAMPWVFLAIVAGVIALIMMVWPDGPTRYDLPSAHPAVREYFPYFVMTVMGGMLWVLLSVVAYVKCHEFWHYEKPEWAKGDEDLEKDWRSDFMDCPECDEREPDVWHTVGECEHWGTTP